MYDSDSAKMRYDAKNVYRLHLTVKDCKHRLSGHNQIKYILKQLKTGTAKVAHWHNLYKAVSSSVMIGRYLETIGAPLALLKDDFKCYTETLEETYAVLNAMIDFEESYSENRLVMSPGVDPELDRAKSMYRNLPSLLTRVAQDESRRFKAETCSVAYVPMIGYLVSLPHDFQVEEFEDVEVIYATRHTLHAKSERMRTLDEELGDVKMRIVDKETTITLRMSSLILSRSKLLFAVERAGALLDATISLALTARQLGWNRPKFVDEVIIDATRVVHPLAVLTTEHFIPNPISSGGKNSKIKIFTGPNACGKSVYLKQVGVLVFLAHIGSFVPAEVARIGTVSRIFSRMYTVDSVLDGLSTFAKDLDQVSLALRRGNDRSLIIIDEFGKGTMTTMEVLKKGAELNFQYRLVDGLVDSSFASYTATKMGVSADVVIRANEIYEHIRGGHALSELSYDVSKEERKNSWLAERMRRLLPQIKVLNFECDNEDLLYLLKETLFASDEIIQQDSNQESKITEEEESETKNEDDENEENTEEQQNSIPQLMHSISEDETCESHDELKDNNSSISNTLRRKVKNTDRSKLSVSFAMDQMQDTETETLAALAVTSELEYVEHTQHLEIADSDDESTSEFGNCSALVHAVHTTSTNVEIKGKNTKSCCGVKRKQSTKRRSSPPPSPELLPRKRAQSF